MLVHTNGRFQSWNLHVSRVYSKQMDFGGILKSLKVVSESAIPSVTMCASKGMYERH